MNHGNMGLESSPALGELAAALVKFQGAVGGAARGGTNDNIGNRYTRLEDAWSAARKALKKHGISVTQWPVESREGTAAMVTRVMHESGEWMQSRCTIPVLGRDPQSYGSAYSYLRRYSLLAALGLPSIDDDAEAAMAAPKEQKQTPAPRQRRRQRKARKPTTTPEEQAAKAVELLGRLEAASAYHELGKALQEATAAHKGGAIDDEQYRELRDVSTRVRETIAARTAEDAEVKEDHGADLGGRVGDLPTSRSKSA